MHAHNTPEEDFRYNETIRFNLGYEFAKPEAVPAGTVYVYKPYVTETGDGDAWVNVEFQEKDVSTSDMYFDATDLENLAIFLLYTARQARMTPGYHNPPTDEELKLWN